MGACLFCGRERRMSKEHVLPQWINETPMGEGPVSIRRVARRIPPSRPKVQVVGLLSTVVMAPKIV
jgi:hypothetical protein